MNRALACVLALALALGVGCAYPRRTTSLVAVDRPTGMFDPPAEVWQLKIVSAELPPTSRGGQPWDGDDDPPDVFVRVYRANELLWETPTIDNTLTPRWDVALPKNVWMPRDQELRFELWDRDGLTFEPAGIATRQGAPLDAVPDSDFLIRLDGGATLTIQLARPKAHRGIGITSYEVHSDAFVVVEVIERSPAGRAGIGVGDRIVSIGGKSIEELGAARAASALSLAPDQGATLEVVGDGHPRRTVEIDQGYTWVVM